MKNKMFAALLAFLMVLPLGGTANAGEVNIPDANFANALRSLTGTPSNAALTDTALAGLTGTIDLSGRGITDISGIHYLANVEYLNLSLNQIEDIPSRIGRLVNLKGLDISGNSFESLPSEMSSLSSLKSLNISANRLDSLPGAIGQLKLDEFRCDYCFLDVSQGSQTLGTIAATGATTTAYLNQLIPVQNIHVYCPADGVLELSWDPLSDIDFGNGVTASVARYSVRTLKPFSFKEAVSASNNIYHEKGLDASKQYTYQVSADYQLKGTKYASNYTKLYVGVQFYPKAMPSPTPTPEPTPEPSPTPEPTQVVTATPAPTPVPVVTDTPLPTQEPAQTGGNPIKALTILLVILCIAFLIVAVLFVAKIVSDRRNARW